MGSRQKGLTLLEIVVALAILGAGLMAIIELFAGGLRLGRASEEYTKATQYARLKWEEFSLRPIETEGVEEGEFDKTYRWRIVTKRVKILPFEEEGDLTLPVELLHIRLEVTWKSGLRERSMDIESYRCVKREADEKRS
ncbi:MAG: prepilin-type N-terminal cleavage/methylation domain-containing protein [Desulfobacterota bacterium]|nr:prepilin-type N-terminal cleavage/methylation domain-containing protein [Thermodesulfobacteriota bacterium]